MGGELDWVIGWIDRCVLLLAPCREKKKKKKSRIRVTLRDQEYWPQWGHTGSQRKNLTEAAAPKPERVPCQDMSPMVHLVGTLHQEHTTKNEKHREKFLIMIFLLVSLAMDQCYLIRVISGVVCQLLIICEWIVGEPIAVIFKFLWLLPKSKDFTT